ncbi:hypothetical protein [Photobacterium damselae]|uniref:hypothetical protein n=1 Tax=Photobacterium damselae TaxID=38293 RepID=UPI00159FCEA0|nr:hypothetical protein [Photobacterium damselae]NVO62719.1 hypothetical protein [Photobacterium damselae subsp. damselae]
MKSYCQKIIPNTNQEQQLQVSSASSDHYVNGSWSKLELKAHLCRFIDFLSGNNEVELIQADLDAVLFILKKITTNKGFAKLIKVFGLFSPNKGGAPNIKPFQGGAFLLMGHFLNGFPVSQMKAGEMCSILGFKTADGEDFQTQVYRLTNKFKAKAIKSQHQPEVVRITNYALNLWGSRNYLLKLNKKIDNPNAIKLKDELINKFKDLTYKECEEIAKKHLNDQNPYEVMVVSK